MKIVLIHNIMWSHYKARVFSDLAALVGEEDDLDLKVIQIAATDHNRKGIGAPDPSLHRYDYTLLFSGSFVDTTYRQRFGALSREIAKEKPDICILNGYDDPAVWLLTLTLRLKGITLMQVCDSTYVDRPRIYWRERFKAFLLSQAALIYCYGSLQKEYLRYLSVPEEKMHVRFQATDNAKFIGNNQTVSLPDFPERFFLYVGRYSPEKNLLRLIRVFEELDTDWGLVLVGSGPQRDELAAAVNPDQAHRIRIEPPKPWDEVVAYYNSASVFILPSLRDPWGLVVNEAMLCKLPVLVSNHCGCSADLVEEGVNGYTFDPKSDDGLMAAVRQILDDERRLADMGEASFIKIQPYNPRNSARQMLAGIRKVIDRHLK